MSSQAALGVVVVLHGVARDDSLALRSLLGILDSRSDVVVLVQDNSTTSDVQPLPAAVTEFRHRASNPGLADAYGWAADVLWQRDGAWLLLLDQDTEVTAPFLDEVLSVVEGRTPVPPDVAVLAPRLVDGDRTLSPHRGVRLRTRVVDEPRPGPAREPVVHLNSGSVLRLSALESIGGFPSDYPLDYLDHAISARLRENGFRTWLLGATLEHRLSLLDRRLLSRTRQASVMEAEHRFVNEHGTRADRAWLAARAWLGVLLSVTHQRSSPSVRDEVSAASRATFTTLGPLRRDGHA